MIACVFILNITPVWCQFTRGLTPSFMINFVSFLVSMLPRFCTVYLATYSYYWYLVQTSEITTEIEAKIHCTHMKLCCSETENTLQIHCCLQGLFNIG